MRDRPAADHHHPHDHLHVVRLAVAAVAVLGELRRTRPFEIRAGDVVEHQLRFQTEQVAQATIQRHLDLGLGLHQPVQGSIPGVELLMMDPHPAALLPVRHETPPLPIADEIGLQPTRQPVLALGSGESIGHQHEGAVGIRDGLGTPQDLIEQRPQSQLLEEVTKDQDRTPGGCVEDLDVLFRPPVDRRRPFQHAPKLRQHGAEQILAAQIGDDALLDFAVLAVGFDHADVLVDRAAGGRDFDGADVHAR